MREKKYANVLLENEEKENSKKILNNSKNTKNDSVKVSLTRELNFKELQDDIDKLSPEELKKEINEDFELTDAVDRKIIQKRFEKFADNVDSKNRSIEERDKDDDELALPMEKGTTRIVGAYAKKEDEEETNETEEIYLTNSFKPFIKRIKVSKVIGKLVKLLIIILLLVLFGLFVIIPIYNLYIDGKPLNVFNNSITYVEEKMIGYIDDLYNNDNLNINSYFSFNNNEIFKNYKTYFNIGVDSKNEYIEHDFYVNNGENVGVSIINKKEDVYNNYVNSNTYLKSTEKEEIKGFYKLGGSDYKYIISKISTIVKDCISNQKLETKRDTIEVRSETIKVFKNSLKMDNDSLNLFNDSIINKVLEDNELSKKLSILLDINETELKSKLVSILESESRTFNIYSIYTIKGIKVIGFDMESDGFRNFYWYSNKEGDSDSYINLSNSEERIIYNIEGLKENNGTIFRIKYNMEDKGTIKINSLENDKVLFEFAYKYQDIEYKGTGVINILQKDRSNMEINDDNVIENNDKNSNKVKDEYLKSLNNEEDYNVFEEWFKLIGSLLYD